MSKLTTALVFMNMIPLVVFFQLIIIPVGFPHLVGTPASWLFSTMFSAIWNLILYLIIKIRDRRIAQGM